METLSTQIKQLSHKTAELQNLENRISQLKQQQKLQESSNHITQKKVDKIMHAKKLALLDNLELDRRRKDQSRNDTGQLNQIRMMRQIQAEENKKAKVELQDEKYLKSALLKQQLELTQLKFKQQKDLELQERQLQYQKISEWEYNLKQELELRKIEKIESIRTAQKDLKNQMAARMKEQKQMFDSLVDQEQYLLNQLQESQNKGQNLKNELMSAMNISVKEYNSITGAVGHKSISQTNLSSKHLESPYAQVPTILRQNRVKKQPINQKSFRENVLKEYQYSLPTLYKPTSVEQQQQVDRLYRGKDKQQDYSQFYNNHVHQQSEQISMSKSDGIIQPNTKNELSNKSKQPIVKQKNDEVQKSIVKQPAAAKEIKQEPTKPKQEPSKPKQESKVVPKEEPKKEPEQQQEPQEGKNIEDEDEYDKQDDEENYNDDGEFEKEQEKADEEDEYEQDEDQQ